MATPYVGQLSLVAFNFPPNAPNAWALAAGQIMLISSNTALFSLLGTTYGGDGRSNFGLPNLQASVAIGVGQSPGLNQYFLGETGGVPNVTLQASQTPNHTHQPVGRETTTAKQPSPVGNSFAESATNNPIYSAATQPLNPATPAAVSMFGNSGPHNNLMPYLGMYWIIALQGVFPPRQ
jgi:microcystin-dependent protein